MIGRGSWYYSRLYKSIYRGGCCSQTAPMNRFVGAAIVPTAPANRFLGAAGNHPYKCMIHRDGMVGTAN